VGSITALAIILLFWPMLSKLMAKKAWNTGK
jgi:hypothetical protein